LYTNQKRIKSETQKSVASGLVSQPLVAMQGHNSGSAVRASDIDSVDGGLLNSDANPMAFKRVASNFSSYANVTNSILGAGILGLPYAFANTGWVLGPIFLALACTFSLIGLHLLSCVSAKTGFPSTIYSCCRPYGKALPMFVDIMMSLYLFGTSCAYLVVIGDMMPEACSQLGLTGAWLHRSLWVLVGFCIAAPFSMPHEIDFLKYTSTACIAAICFITVVVLAYAMPSTPNPCTQQEMEDDDAPCVGAHITTTGINVVEVIKVFPLFIFGVCVHVNVFPIVTEVKEATVFNMDKIYTASIGTTAVIYSIVAVCGYMTYGGSIHSDLLVNYPVVAVITVARIMITFCVTFTFPLQVNPARRSLMTVLATLLDNGKEPSVSTIRFRYYAITFAFMALALLVGLLVTDLGNVLSVNGATGCTTIMFIMPGLLYLSYYPADDSNSANKDMKEPLLPIDGDDNEAALSKGEKDFALTGLGGEGAAAGAGTNGGAGFTPAPVGDIVFDNKQLYDMPIPENTPLRRGLAWLQLGLGLILFPTCIVAIFL
jgi:amino acid permease